MMDFPRLAQVGIISLAVGMFCVVTAPASAETAPWAACVKAWTESGGSVGSYPDCEFERSCTRTDSDIEPVSEGTPDDQTASTTCNNCTAKKPNCTCAEAPPDTRSCKALAGVGYTESVEASVGASITASGSVIVAELEGTLEASIGHTTAREFTIGCECPINAAACTIRSGSAVLKAFKDIEKKMTHTYTMTQTHNGGEDCEGAFNGTKTLTDTSTVTGNAYGECDCPAETVEECPEEE